MKNFGQTAVRNTFSIKYWKVSLGIISMILQRQKYMLFIDNLISHLEEEQGQLEASGSATLALLFPVT